jgi:predicted Zn-ribbon and HTH transcriptional regulator
MPRSRDYKTNANKMSGGLDNTRKLLTNIKDKVKDGLNDNNEKQVIEALNQVNKTLNSVDKALNLVNKQFKKNASPDLKKINKIPTNASYKTYVGKAGMFSSGLKVKSVPPVANMDNILNNINRNAKKGDKNKRMRNIEERVKKAGERIEKTENKVIGKFNMNTTRNSNRLTFKR